jgi:hypothetical protein
MSYFLLFSIVLPFWALAFVLVYALLFRGKSPNSTISENEWLEYKQKVDGLVLKQAVSRK